jgi:hypothetical protein
MTFSTHTHVKRTRKSFRCVWCGERIDTGQPCDALVGLTEDNEIASVRYHPECYAALSTLPRDEWDLWEWGDFLRGCTCQAGAECRCKTRKGQQ